MTLLLIAAGVVGLVALWGALTYYALVRARSRVNRAWREVEGHLRRRHDLVPDLVQALEAHPRREPHVLSELTEARAAAAGSQARVFRERAESRLSGALAVARSAAAGSPEVRTARGLAPLEAQLAEVEEDIAAARRAFNSTVQRYNDLIGSLLAAPLAGAAGFRGRQYFDVETSSERCVPGKPARGARPGGIAAA